MDISAVRAGASLGLGSPETSSGAPAATADTFASVLESTSNVKATTLDAAERMVGTRISPPPGGCRCDALVAAASPDGVPFDPSTTANPSGTGQRPRVTPGDVLVLSANAPNERAHLAIARSVTEMIAANAMGIVEIMPIPWERLLATEPQHR